MTTVAPNPSPLPDPTTGRRPHKVLAALGAVLITVGLLAAAAAAGVIAAFGSGSTLDSGTRQVATATAALVTDVASVRNVHGIGSVTGWPTLRVSAEGPNPAGVFIGVGPADAVTEYLSGVAVEEVTDFAVDPFALVVSGRPGAANASPPGEQEFWVASATSGSLAELTWPMQDGDYRLVVMNGDGSPAVISQARFQVTLPQAFPISLGVLAGSGLVVAGGVALLATAVSRGRQRPAGWHSADHG